MTDSDETLVERLKAGQPAAYAVLIERFEGPLYRFFYCDHGDHHTAQDQTAETLAQLVRSFSRLRDACQNLRGYVFATARHVQLRRVRRRRSPTSSLSDSPEVCDNRPGPSAVAADRELLELTLQTMRAWEDPARSVLLLRFVEGCSIQEIAAALELPEGTVKSHIHRGRSRLRQVLAEKDHDL